MFNTIELYARYAVKLYKNKPHKYLNQGARAQRAGPGPAFVLHVYDIF